MTPHEITFTGRMCYHYEEDVRFYVTGYNEVGTGLRVGCSGYVIEHKAIDDNSHTATTRWTYLPRWARLA